MMRCPAVKNGWQRKLLPVTGRRGSLRRIADYERKVIEDLWSTGVRRSSGSAALRWRLLMGYVPGGKESGLWVVASMMLGAKGLPTDGGGVPEG